MTISIYFGALCDPISKQLIAQGYSIAENDSLRLQDIADAIIMLKLHRIIPDWRIIRSALMRFALCLMVWIPYWFVICKSNAVRARDESNELT